MSPITSPSSDELMQLPAVPRRRSSVKGGDEQSKKDTPKTSRNGGEFGKRKVRDTPRGRRKGKRDLESVHSDGDEDEEDESERSLPVRRGSRRSLQPRKISEDDDDDMEDNEAEDEDEMDSSKSDSVSPQPTKRKRISSVKVRSSDSSGSSSSPEEKVAKRRKQKDTSGDSTSKGDGEGTDEPDGGSGEAVPGQNDILAQLEKEAGNEDSDDFDSDDSEIEKVPKKQKVERLTSRQRAMQGEKVKLEYTKLESPKSKKQSAAEEEWSHDEEMELKRQQKARLRQMINEKRNKEKRAAMVDKVLRGVTSKRKKFTMATEARAAQVGNRLNQNEAREGCIRFISGQNGISLSLPKEIDEPSYLQNSIKASYPRACTRDPRTGKRIFAEA